MVAIAAAILLFFVATWVGSMFLPGLVAEYRLIWRLRSVHEAERKEAGEKLVEMGSVRALPRLLAIPGDDAAARICRMRGAAAVPALLRTVDAGEDHAPRMAIALLAEIGPEAGPAVPRLIELLDDSRRDVRVSAADALCEIAAHHPRVLSTLKRWLVDPDPDMRFEAARLAQAIGEEARTAIPELVECLRRDRGDARHEAAVWALIALGGEAATAVAPLLAALDERVRWTAVDVIGSISYRCRCCSIGAGDSSQVPALVRALDDPSEDVREESIRALGYIAADAREAAPALARIVLGGSGDLRWRAAQSLARMGQWSDEAIAAVLRCIDEVDGAKRPVSTLRDLLFALADSRPPPMKVLPILLRVLRNDDAWERKLALEVLVELLPSAVEALPVLEQASRDPDRRVQAWARCCLSRFRPELRQALLDDLIEDLKTGDRRLKQEACKVLTVLGGEAKRAAPLAIELALTDRCDTDLVVSIWKLLASADDVRPIIEALRGSDPARKRRALVMFFHGSLGPAARSAMPALAEALHASDGDLRRDACGALRNMGRDCPEAVLMLKEALRDRDRQVRASARSALRQIERDVRPGAGSRR